MSKYFFEFDVYSPNPPLFPSPIDYVLPLSERKCKCDYGDIIDFQVWLAELVSLL